MTDIAEYLRSKGLKVHQANDSNVHVPCFFHGEEEDDRGRLYVNVDPNQSPGGMFVCFVCGETGAFNKIRKHFGDSPITNTSSSSNVGLPDDMFLAILNNATDYYHERLGENPDAYKYLKDKRGLSFETITKNKLGWADGTLLTHLVSEGFELEDIKRTGLVDKFGGDFLVDKITIPYQVLGQAVQIRGKDMEGKYVTPPGQKARLYNSDACLNDRVVICEGEFDAMMMEEMGFSACGVPGANSWQDSWTDYLSAAKRVHVCFDNDSAGRAGAEKLSKKLGAKARIVEMPEGVDVTDWVVVHGKNADDFEFLFSKAVGGLLVTVRQAADRWLEVEGNNDLVGIRFNVKQLDDVMRYGLLPGQVVTLIAKTNAGKSLISFNLFHRMALAKPDIKILLLSLEQTRNEWFERARRIHSFYNPEINILTPDDTVSFWENKICLADKNRMREEDVIQCIEQFEYEMGCVPDIVCIDYLGYYSRSFKGEAYERTTAAVMGLKHIAKEKQTIFYAPHQVNRTGSFGKEIAADMAKESGAVEETSDMMLGIWNPDQQVGKTMHDQSGEIHMKVLKSRDGPVGQIVVYTFCPRTLAIVPVTDPLITRASQEREYANNADTWETVIYRFRTGDRSWKLDPEDVMRFLKESHGMG